MKKVFGIIGILLVLSLTIPRTAGLEIDPEKIHFYMYGMKTCPHCQKMKEEIPKIYGEDSLTYYELVGNDENGKLFQILYQNTGISGVPAIAIVYNGTLYAVIEGEFKVNATPQIIEEAMKAKGVLLVVGGKVWLLPSNDTKAMELANILYSLFVEHKAPETSSSSTPQDTSTTTTKTTSPSTTSSSNPPESSTGSPQGNEGSICGPGIMLLVPIAVLGLRRRR